MLLLVRIIVWFIGAVIFLTSHLASCQNDVQQLYNSLPQLNPHLQLALDSHHVANHLITFPKQNPEHKRSGRINSINLRCPMEATYCGGNDVISFDVVASWQDCGQLCNLEDACAFWTFHKFSNKCKLKYACEDQRSAISSYITGYHTCSGGTSTSDDRLGESTTPACPKVAAPTPVEIPTCPPCAAPTPVVIPTCPPAALPIPEKKTRSDMRCGVEFPLSDGSPSECSNCCSDSGWCGDTPAHCDCPTCVDYRLPTCTPVAAQTDRPDCDEEVKKCNDQYKERIDKVSKMNGGFFWAAVYSDPSWNIPLDYIPEFMDIEKTTANFLRNSTFGSIIFGDSSSSVGKVTLYQNSHDKRFVRVEYENGNESIFAYDKDRNLIKDGIYRDSWPNGAVGVVLHLEIDFLEEMEERMAGYTGFF